MSADSEIHIEDGVVLKCDQSIKIFVQSLETKGIVNDGHAFILEDLGPVGLFVKKDCVAEIEEHVSDMLDLNHFEDGVN
eukprot:gene6693-9450_t